MKLDPLKKLYKYDFQSKWKNLNIEKIITNHFIETSQNKSSFLKSKKRLNKHKKEEVEFSFILKQWQFFT